MPTFRPTTTAALIRETAERLGDQPLIPVDFVSNGPTDPLPGKLPPPPFRSIAREEFWDGPGVLLPELSSSPPRPRTIRPDRARFFYSTHPRPRIQSVVHLNGMSRIAQGMMESTRVRTTAGGKS